LPTAEKEPPLPVAFEELEKIAEKFEGEEVDLEKGLKDFERGLELASICKKKLGALEARVKEIQEKFEV
ncbi:MAG TPA: exodeoxyribonuclease VII small subunit, partial [Patescibacteria group bacterium]|nr:exodeoxyribonuclease VII small subunit [Patescibacteria group bacterium]